MSNPFVLEIHFYYHPCEVILYKCFPAVLSFLHASSAVTRVMSSAAQEAKCPSDNRVCGFCFAFLCQLNIETVILLKNVSVVDMVHIYIGMFLYLVPVCFYFLSRANGRKLTYVWSVEIVGTRQSELCIWNGNKPHETSTKQIFLSISWPATPIEDVLVFFEGVTLSITQRFIKEAHPLVVNLFTTCDPRLHYWPLVVSERNKLRKAGTQIVNIESNANIHSAQIEWYRISVNFGASVPVRIAFSALWPRANWSDGKKVDFFLFSL